MFKRHFQKKLEKYVREYFVKHPDVKLVIVAGSVGKTSTKIAIATVLAERYRVRVHKGNHATFLNTPLAVLGIDYPKHAKGFKAWKMVFAAAEERINNPTDVDVIVQELSSERIGQIPHFGTYLNPDISVVTAISPEHMEYFHTVDNVAREEMAVTKFSKQVLINRDDIDGAYAKYLTNATVNTYGTSAIAEYHFISENYTAEDGHSGMFVMPESKNPTPVSIHVLGEHTLRPAIAAGAVASKLGMNATEIASGLAKIRPLPGRMNMLRGVEGTIIIDDTYNSSPLAAQSSLRELYQLPSPQRILVLGDMSELGETSSMEHHKLGELCDSSQLAWVVTVGKQTEKYLAQAAKIKGCQVRSFQNALDAGSFVHSVLEKGAVILFKASEDIYLEEAVKIILHATTDESQLVRQSPEWMERKSTFFQKDFK